MGRCANSIGGSRTRNTTPASISNPSPASHTRKTCVRAVKRTTGSIRYDRIYAYQRGGLEPEEDEDGEEN